jgi:hypothetical protein
VNAPSADASTRILGRRSIGPSPSVAAAPGPGSGRGIVLGASVGAARSGAPADGTKAAAPPDARAAGPGLTRRPGSGDSTPHPRAERR